jgi:hypothetical protein
MYCLALNGSVRRPQHTTPGGLFHALAGRTRRRTPVIATGPSQIAETHPPGKNARSAASPALQQNPPSGLCSITDR